MALPRPETRPPIRQVNDLLAEAYRAAIAAGDTYLASQIDKSWRRAAGLCQDHEDARDAEQVA